MNRPESLGGTATWESRRVAITKFRKSSEEQWSAQPIPLEDEATRESATRREAAALTRRVTAMCSRADVATAKRHHCGARSKRFVSPPLAEVTAWQKLEM